MMSHKRQTRSITSESDVLKLIFSHNVNSYKEVANTKAYTIEMLLGQVGGFVGRSLNITIHVV